MSESTGKLFVVFLLLTLYMVTFGDLQTVNTAKAYPTYGIPPKVNVPETNINATIFRVDEAFWVKIDAEYKMHAVYALGDSYIAENTGMGLIADPSPYVTVVVTQDTLEAHYPIPFNATKISVRVDGREVELQQDTHGYFHLFDANLPEINWTVSPVSRDFDVTVHYEHPISKTSEVFSYLGDYAFTLPLYGRYGCSNISYPLYSWYGYSPNKYSIQIESDLNELQAYSIDTRGTLTPVNHTLIDGEAGRITITFSQEEESPSVHGAVVVFNVPAEENMTFPTLSVAAASLAVVALAAAGLLVYHKRNSVKKV
jgi:hypothetical protein